MELRRPIFNISRFKRERELATIVTAYSVTGSRLV